MGVPLLTVSVAAGWCPAPFPAGKLLAAARTLAKREMHDLQDHSGIFQVRMFCLMVNITFGSKFIIPGLEKLKQNIN